MRKKDRLAAVSQRPSETSATLLGFLNGLCGVADHVQHSLWLGEHRDVTGAQLDGCGAHALCNETLQFGLDGAIFSGHDVPTRLRPPSDAVDLLVEQVGHRCGLGRPNKLLLRLGQITLKIKTLLVTEDSDEADRQRARELGRQKGGSKPYKAVVSVLMLREGWD